MMGLLGFLSLGQDEILSDGLSLMVTGLGQQSTLSQGPRAKQCRLIRNPPLVSPLSQNLLPSFLAVLGGTRPSVGHMSGA